MQFAPLEYKKVYIINENLIKQIFVLPERKIRVLTFFAVA